MHKKLSSIMNEKIIIRVKEVNILLAFQFHHCNAMLMKFNHGIGDMHDVYLTSV